jgi:hypothetical protein
LPKENPGEVVDKSREVLCKRRRTLFGRRLASNGETTRFTALTVVKGAMRTSPAVVGRSRFRELLVANRHMLALSRLYTHGRRQVQCRCKQEDRASRRIVLRLGLVVAFGQLLQNYGSSF